MNNLLVGAIVTTSFVCLVMSQQSLESRVRKLESKLAEKEKPVAARSFRAQPLSLRNLPRAPFPPAGSANLAPSTDLDRLRQELRDDIKQVNSKLADQQSMILRTARMATARNTNSPSAKVLPPRKVAGPAVPHATSTNPPPGSDVDQLRQELHDDVTKINWQLVNLLPLGSVVAWNGPLGNLPAGWALCDGTVVNGYQTPNLQGKFLRGLAKADTFIAGGIPGGNDSSPTLNVSISGYCHDIYSGGDSIKDRNSYVPVPTAIFTTNGEPWSAYDVPTFDVSGGNIVGGLHHYHTGGSGQITASGSLASFDKKPAFVGLYYIVKYQ